MKRRTREWSLSARDLPHPGLIEDEPLLQDMENNAAYRMMLYRRCYVPFAFRHPHLLGWIYVASFAICVMLFGVMAILVVPLALLLLRWVSHKTRARGDVFILGLTPEHIRDLVEAGYRPHDFTIALWGYHTLSPLGPKLSRLFPYCMALLLIVFPLFIRSFSDSTRLMTYFPIPSMLSGTWLAFLQMPAAFWNGIQIGYQPYAGYAALSLARRTLERCNDVNESGGFVLFVGCRNAALSFLFLMLGGVGVLVYWDMFVQNNSESFLFTSLIPSLTILSVILCGTIVGRLRGRLLAIRASEFRYTLRSMDSGVMEIIRSCQDGIKES